MDTLSVIAVPKNNDSLFPTGYQLLITPHQEVESQELLPQLGLHNKFQANWSCRVGFWLLKPRGIKSNEPEDVKECYECCALDLM